MRRPVNLLIGLAVVIGVSYFLFGSIGGGERTSGFNPPPQGEGPSGIPQLDVAAGIVGPSSSQPPPIPATARFPTVPMSTRMKQRLADPAALSGKH